MRWIPMFLILSLILSGCGQGSKPLPTEPPSLPRETEPPTTQAPETTPTQPADPMVQLLESLTLEEKVGQMFLARCPEENAIADLQTYHLGGYILFGRDFDGQTPDTLKATLAGYQSAARLPLLLAVDEEGGTVCRVSNHTAFRAQRFPSPRDAYAAGGLEQAIAAEGEKAEFLMQLGIPVNMAPVCDITTDPKGFLYRRSLGQSPEETGRFVSGAVAAMHQNGLGCVLKHFPGYGNNADTHTGIARDDRPLETLENADLVPFAAGIQAGCDAILVSHILVSALDETAPASLSPAVHDYLRNTMGFDGVIVTDDLVMEAITQVYGVGEAAVQAVLAGNDLLCSTEYPVQYAAVLEAVQRDQIPEDLINDAVLRILRWKQNLGFFR